VSWDRTLADRVVRETLRPHTVLKQDTNRPMPDLRKAMLAARKFVLSPFTAYQSRLTKAMPGSCWKSKWTARP
jgi:hypothetical protein